ncbi:hypothetical protein Tco_0883016 [Tanacetum coccineum]
MMANLSKDIQSASSDTHPLMLDRSDFESWQQRICLYCLGKENGENILQSIDEGPFKIGKYRETLADGALGPEQDIVIKDFTPEEKERYKADIRATNLLLQGFPKDIYTLINHYTNAKDIWDNVKMILEGSEFVTTIKLNRGLKTSNYDQLYAYLKQHEAHANENKMMLERYTQHGIDPLAFVSNILLLQIVVQNVQGRQNRVQGNNARGAVAAGNGGVQNRVGNANLGQAKPIKCCGQDSTFDNDVDEPPIQDLALNVDHVFQADQCNAFDSDVDEAPTTQTMFMANLSLADPIYDEAGPSYDLDILSEVQDHDNYIDSVGEYHEYVKDNAVQVVQSNVSYVPNDALMMIMNDMHEQKENKYLEDFLDMKALKETIEDKLFKQDQSLQTAYMLCKPKPFYDEKKKVAIGYKNPLYLTSAMQVQYALYNGHEIVKTNHAPAVVHDSRDTLELARKNLLTENENLLADCLSSELLYSVMNAVNTVSRFSELHDAYIVEQAHKVELEAGISKLKHKIQKDNHSEND